MIWIWIGAGGVAGLVLLVIGIGLLLPRCHVVARRLRSGQPPEAIWQVVTDYAALPTWHPHVKAAERLPDQNGREVWRETYRDGSPLTLVTFEASPPRRLVRSIADDKGPFSGRWEFEIVPEAGGSRITITEYGEISHPVFRFMARLFMNPAMYLEMYLKALASKFGEPALIEPNAEQSGSATCSPTLKGV